MIHTLKLTQSETELLLEILESQQRALMLEISNTDALRAKAELRKRARSIDQLVERLRNEVTAVGQTV